MVRNERRRRVLQALAAGAAVGLAGCGSQSGTTDTPTDGGTPTGTPTDTATPAATPTETPGETDPPDPGERITSARRVGVRDVTDYTYRSLWSTRKQKALEVVLSDPRVSDVASDWIASFESYDPYTNFLDAVGVQGTTDMSVDGSIESGEFDVTATDRQTVYGLVDRRTDEIVALQINDPIDVQWTRTFTGGGESGRKRHEFVLSHDRVMQHLEGREWYPLVKVAEIITAYSDHPHGAVTPVAYFVKEDGELSVVSTFLDVSGEELELLDVTKVEEFVEHSPQELARELGTDGESVLGQVPEVPQAKRPQITAANGFHLVEAPDESLTEAGWDVTWQPPQTVGAVVSASFNGKPVFEGLAPYSTHTGYDLPPREGRSTADWFFPEDNTVFSGELLYWDIHSSQFGGPGMLNKESYPATGRHPPGFRIRTHYHTGALPNARDFHSGHRFGPYNYYISYDFYEDGVFMPVWQRQGPGYVTEFMFDRDREHTGPVQYYISAWAMVPTPGTTDGVETRVFDGDAWTTPDTEFYLRGDEETMVRFANPDGPEAIDIPLDETTEVVVVRPHDDEIGEALRVVNPQAELEFYHPAQYVSDEPIQGESVYAWLLFEGPTFELPHSAGITTFSAFGELNLQGY